MMRRPMLATLTVWLVPLLLSPAITLASGTTTTSDVSALAAPIGDGLAPLASAVHDDATAAPTSQFTVAEVYRTARELASFNRRYESVRYRPRRERYYRDREPSRFHGTSQIHAGFLDPEGSVGPGFLVGFRGGQQIDQMIELGLGIDWRNKSGNATEILQESTGPGGEKIIVRRQLNRFSSNLFPLLAYVQVAAPSNMGVVPYFGAAASYQALFLSAEDFQTGQQFDATYDGWGWQLWGGAAMPLGGNSRLVGEIFLNNADLNRDVFDPATGETLRETVSTNGVGGRFGLNWGF